MIVQIQACDPVIVTIEDTLDNEMMCGILRLLWIPFANLDALTSLV